MNAARTDVCWLSQEIRQDKRRKTSPATALSASASSSWASPRAGMDRKRERGVSPPVSLKSAKKKNLLGKRRYRTGQRQLRQIDVLRGPFRDKKRLVRREKEMRSSSYPDAGDFKQRNLRILRNPDKSTRYARLFLLPMYRCISCTPHRRISKGPLSTPAWRVCTCGGDFPLALFSARSSHSRPTLARLNTHPSPQRKAKTSETKVPNS